MDAVKERDGIVGSLRIICIEAPCGARWKFQFTTHLFPETTKTTRAHLFSPWCFKYFNPIDVSSILWGITSLGRRISIGGGGGDGRLMSIASCDTNFDKTES
ncbi:hypothetical protein ACOSP7_020029 [Xanthoceras sorbifolium]